MKNFYLYLFFSLLLVIFSWTNLYSAIGFRIQTQNFSRWKYKFDFINNTNLDFKTLVIGDSTTDAAVIPKLQNNERYNLSLGGSSTIDAYFLLKRYLKNNHKLTNLVIGYNSQSFDKREFFIRHGLMLNMFSFLELAELGSELDDDLNLLDSNNLGFSSGTINFFKNLKIVRYLYYYELLTIQLSLSNYQLNLVGNLFNPSLYKLNYNKYIESLANPYVNLDVRTEVNDKISSDVAPKLIVNKLFNLYLLKILELAKENRISVYIIHPPINQIYNDNKMLMSAYSKYLNLLSLKHPEVHIFPKSLVYPKQLFKDTVHIDKIGSESFTETLVEFITKK